MRTSFAGSCETHIAGDDARELGVKEQDHVEEHPHDRQHDSRPVLTFLAHCVAQHEGPVRVIAGVEAHLRCDDDFEDDDEVEGKAKLPWGVTQVGQGRGEMMAVRLGVILRQQG